LVNASLSSTGVEISIFSQSSSFSSDLPGSSGMIDVPFPLVARVGLPISFVGIFIKRLEFGGASWYVSADFRKHVSLMPVAPVKTE
jgi:hypothetical protein